MLELPAASIDVEESFFDTGGHSLRAAKVRTMLLLVLLLVVVVLPLRLVLMTLLPMLFLLFVLTPLAARGQARGADRRAGKGTLICCGALY